ncbi:uncharacterized protein PHACADRAFT_168224 [Phanerochaete carnosa HHB-10118-sp]|uniref:Uncharacterized protein n=1 Tax=Phanerochaete carnosa (strain HHB-10118-sp) TaxID=650164 RepID=K5WNW1_PHACS|nr:uncharacterized protein PHACADRAFT_168224 [Phanerochaete carnosa HHB-10118-sp]EKM60884.1 hypothetical protein PHACADRAFT_168224 [Phanerochaete carnosa HHB-10118-sp]
MLFSKHLRRREAAWEVVDCRDISPIPMWDEDEDLEIAYTHPTNISYRFVYDLQTVEDLRKAVQVARCQLYRDAVRLKCNILLSEGWRCTLMRQGSRHRVEVVYSGRPARALGMGKVTCLSQPPFIGMLDNYEHQIVHYQEPQRRRVFRAWSRTSSMS